MARSTSLKLAALCLISFNLPTTFALSAAMVLFPRDSLSCPDSTYTACGAGLPGNFCCPSTSTCIPFNGGQSAVCCPHAKNCTSISPLDCDITLQNATAHPTSPLFSTDLSGNLATCGDSCCPKGMSCINDQCTLPFIPTSTSLTQSATPTPTTSSTSNSASTTAANATPSNTATNITSGQVTGGNANCSQFPAPAVLVGFFSGLVLGILLTVLLICCFGRGRHDRDRTSPDLSSVQATVSDPIYNAGNDTYRSDFLRRESESRHQGRASRVRSLFSRTPTVRSRNGPVDGLGRSIPVPKTPSLKKEASMESIKIYSPEHLGSDRPNTTLTAMLEEAGLKPQGNFVGSPGRVDPRSRRVGDV